MTEERVARRRAAWAVYDDMAATGAYGALLNEAGQVVLAPDGENEAAFFCSVLSGRDRVLDLGCGPGFPGIFLTHCVRAVYGVDASPAMLGQAQRNVATLCIPNICLVRAFAENLPFAGFNFDGIAVCGTLGSVSNPGVVLREMARVAAPGALLASIEQDYRRRLAEGAPREECRLRRDRGYLELQVVQYLTEPYRIRSEHYVLDSASQFAQQFRDLPALLNEGFTATGIRPAHLPPEAIVDTFCEEEAQFDPETLRDACQQTGFDVVEQRTSISYGLPHILSVFRRR